MIKPVDRFTWEKATDRRDAMLMNFFQSLEGRGLDEVYEETFRFGVQGDSAIHVVGNGQWLTVGWERID